jgi:hypothetical protein
MRFVKLAGTIHPADDEAMSWLMQANEGVEIEAKVVTNRRTALQNAALHSFLRDLAQSLNDAHMYLHVFPWKEGAEVTWSMDDCKERLWKPLQEAITGKRRTSDLTTKEVDEVYQPLARKIAQMGVEVPPLGLEHGD